MINSVVLENYCQHEKLEWPALQHINLIIGENSSGKTILMKALYTALKVLESYGKGNDKQSLSTLLSQKLYWTFQPDRLGDLVRKGAPSLLFRMTLDGKEFGYQFGKDTEFQISKKIENEIPAPLSTSSIFIPAKEVLSLFDIILRTRQQNSLFGFDDTYLDLVKALQIAPSKGNNYASFSHGRKKLEKLINGRIEYDSQANEWYYKRGNARFSIGMTSEGIKKISIFTRLLSNRYLDHNSIIFIDEPESALHPKAVMDYLNMIFEMSEAGVQFFIATHSYFVIKKLCLLARQHDVSIPVVSLSNDKAAVYSDMKDGMPDNSIIDESIHLYEEEVDLSLGG